MRVKKLNFQICEDLRKDDFIFIRPYGSKLFRCPFVPDFIKDDQAKHTELVQVLNTICTKAHNGVWYFKFDDADDKEDFLQTLLHMDMEPILGEPDPETYN